MADETEEKEESGPETDDDILEAARVNIRAIIDDEENERQKMMDDLKFCTLDQWPSDIRKERENDVENGARPCLTIDKINPYIDQVVNDVAQGKPGIVVRPQDDESDPQTAKILKGLIRNIEDQSSADIAYSTAVRSSARIGLGYFRILPEYVSEDSFDQDLFIRPVPNTFAVHLGRHTMPDGSDAKRGYISESMSEDKFKELFPKAKFKVDDFNGLGEDLAYWRTGENIVVVEEFVLVPTQQTLHFLADGTTMSAADYKKWPKSAGPKPDIQDTRTSFKRQLKWRKMTGIEVLEKRDLPGKYIPIVEVIGKEAWVDGKRIVWGLVRPSKDSLRMYNYFSSSITEKIGLAIKAPFVGAKGQFEGVEEKWKKANKTNYAYLEYNAIDVNGNAIPAPQRQGSTPMETAMLHQMEVIEHDVQTSLGMFKAAVGETESQQSGRAILALQKESDTGTAHYGHNLGLAIRHAGRILIDLIPHYYDTKRVVRIIGDDGEVQTAQIDPEQEQAHRQIPGPNGAIQSIYNPGVGQYDISITVGPSYNTKRMEAAATFVEMAKGSADPASSAVLRYLVMRNSDSAGADEAAKLLRTLLPPQALQALSSKQPIPPEVQAQMQQMRQHMQMMMEEGQKLQQENTQLKSGAQVKMAEIQTKAAANEKSHQIALAEADSRMQHEIVKAQEEQKLAVWKAKLDAATKIEVAEISAKTALTEAAMKAETEANIELNTALRQGPDGADTAPMSVTIPDIPVKPLDRLAALHTQGMQQHSDSMGRLAQYLQQLVALQQQTLAAILAPKTVGIGAVQKDAEGNIIGAHIVSTPQMSQMH